MPVKLLLPVNKMHTAQHAATLKAVAADLGWPVDVGYIGNGTSGPTVFCEDRQGNKGTRCAYGLNIPYSRQCQARAAAVALLARLVLDPDQGQPS